MRRSRKNLAIGTLGLFLIAGLAFSMAQSQRYRYRPELSGSLYLPSGRLLKEVSLGYRQFVADLVWFSAVQYYGEYRREDHDLRYFVSLIDIVTTLDPHFIFAYTFGAVVVSEDLEAFSEGIAILKSGMSNNPTNWELPFEIGFLNMIHTRDMNVAARYFDLSSRLPGAPERAKRFAAYVYSLSGDTASSIELWEKYKEYTDNPYLKELADRYIARLQASGQGGGRR